MLKVKNTKIEMIPYNSSLAKRFRELNIAWLQKYFVVEPIDEQMLSDPQSFFIDKGGYIFFAKYDGVVVGTFALIKTADGILELSKMAVDESFHGKGIGNQMLEYSLQKAKELGANKLILYSSTILESAIHLYRKYGFREVPLEHSEYKRSNIKMEIPIL